MKYSFEELKQIIEDSGLFRIHKFIPETNDFMPYIEYRLIDTKFIACIDGYINPTEIDWAINDLDRIQKFESIFQEIPETIQEKLIFYFDIFK